MYSTPAGRQSIHRTPQPGSWHEKRKHLHQVWTGGPRVNMDSKGGWQQVDRDHVGLPHLDLQTGDG